MGIKALFIFFFAPQIWQNIIKGCRDVPRFSYAVSISVYAMSLPLMVDFYSSNILYKRPQTFFGIISFSFVIWQLYILWKQRTRPRFLLPKRMREWLLAGPDYYKYEHDFEDETNKSNLSYISDENLKM